MTRSTPRARSGPLITPAAAERVHALVERSVEGGAELVAGDGAVAKEGSFFAPTVIAGAAADSEIARTELFGPVVAVLPFDDVEEAIAIANGTPFGLAAGVQTADLARGIRIAERLEAGTVWINDWATGNLTDPGRRVEAIRVSGARGARRASPGTSSTSRSWRPSER